MPIFREHGLPFTEPEIFQVFPVDERADREVRKIRDG